ncbi:MAG: terpene cyclase/mutase family protein [Phycisphaerales bacterium]|nr:terpene cyclase/mutase family protein [Phycisphaerales bacterium]
MRTDFGILVTLFLTCAVQTISAASDEELDGMVSTGVQHIVAMEEGDDGGEWPYEGVYRYRGDIPIGYRIGGTGIACLAMTLAPGYDEDEARRAAVARGLTFICSGINHELMTPDYDGGYDVRGWGYTYGALCLLTCEQKDLLPPDQDDACRAAARFYVDALQRIEIPEIGGWNYARANGRNNPSPPSSFMTAAALQTLFLARDLGYAVDAAVVDRALDVLDQAQATSGEFVYSGAAEDQRPGGLPGSIGRMVISETTLHLAGRRDVAAVRGAVDAFIVHWEALAEHRARNGTHVPPYGVAPYYFYFAHHYAAQAVELLPRRERAIYRARLNELLTSVRDEGGTWNDRVFKRSANYGTSMAVLAMEMPEIGLPPRWEAPADAPEPAPETGNTPDSTR